MTDYSLMFNQKAKLQEAADAAALASVSELRLSNASSYQKQTITAIADSYARTTFIADGAGVDGDQLHVEVSPDTKAGEVTVKLAYTWTPMFAQYFDRGITPIKVHAKAGLAGGQLTCVIGLMEPQVMAKAAIHLDNESAVLAEDCSVFSNSEPRYGLRADGNARMQARSICSAGGVVQLGKAYFEPEPIVDCPKISDPLARRKAPTIGNCIAKKLKIKKEENVTLWPGVYCGGIDVSDETTVWLNPGTYIVKDGPLVVSKESKLAGQDVSFFLTGDGSLLDFHRDTTINLSAPMTGSMAGVLFFEDRNVKHSFNFNPLIPEKCLMMSGCIEFRAMMLAICSAQFICRKACC